LSATKQSTFDDLYALDYIKKLNQRDINIIRFLEKGYYQADIARRLKCDKALVNRTIKQLEKFGLIIPERIYIQLNNKNVFKQEDLGKIKTIAKADPWNGRRTTYIVTPKLQNYLNQVPSTTNIRPKGDYTFAIPHFYKIKYPILSQNGEIDTKFWKTTRSKTIWFRSAKPKGPHIRHYFHVDTPNGVIGIEYTGKSLIAYQIERNNIMAKDIAEAKQIVAAYIQEGISTFIHEQNREGSCVLILGQPMQIGKPHVAINSKKAKKLLEEGKDLSIPHLPSIHIDNSLEKKGLPGGHEYAEIEGNEDDMDRFDKAFRKAENIEMIVAKSISDSISPLAFNIDEQLGNLVHQVGHIAEAQKKTHENVEVLMMGGTTSEFRMGQLVGVVGKMLEIQNNLEAKVRDIESEKAKERDAKLDRIIKKMGLDE
jgi:predicted transcriptional regulator